MNTDWRRYAIALERYASNLERQREFEALSARYSGATAYGVCGKRPSFKPRPLRSDYELSEGAAE